MINCKCRIREWAGIVDPSGVSILQSIVNIYSEGLVSPSTRFSFIFDDKMWL